MLAILTRGFHWLVQVFVNAVGVNEYFKMFARINMYM